MPMQKWLFLFLVFTLSMLGQVPFVPSPTQQTKAYCQVISEYIKAVTRNKEHHFDTLYIGHHEAFPEIKLPLVIEDKIIIVQANETGKTKPQNQPAFVLINIVELKFEIHKADFLVVTFHQGYQPRHNSYVNLHYDTITNDFNLDKEIRFEYVYKKDN